MRNDPEISALLHSQKEEHYLQPRGDCMEWRDTHRERWLQQTGLRTSCFQSFSDLTSACHNSPGILPSHQLQHFLQANPVCKPVVWYCNTKGPAVSQVPGTLPECMWVKLGTESEGRISFSLLWMMNIPFSPLFNHQNASYIEIETVIISKGTLQSREQRLWNEQDYEI